MENREKNDDAKHSEKKVWLITGVSSGFGKALAKKVSEKGHMVAGTVRKTSEKESSDSDGMPNQNTYIMDVNDSHSVQAGVNQVLVDLGRIDVLVNNAGYAIVGAVEELSDQETRQQFETNVFGLLAVTRAVLPQLRKQRSGHIFNFSSVGGLRGSAGLGAYCATKFAVEGISEALAQEVAPLNIKVTIVEPGNFRTNWAGSSMTRAKTTIEDYAVSSGEVIKSMNTMNGRQVGDPLLAAEAILMVSESEKPPLHFVMGDDAIKYSKMKVEAFLQDMDNWQFLSTMTAFREYAEI